jgi:polysaccharide biosynthesis protein PslH
MSDRPALLFLAHRIPFPPNKGDKLRSYHLLRKLAEGHRVYLGTFIDDPADAAGVPALEPFCAGICAVPIRPVLARLLSLRGLATGEALSAPYYRSASLRRWIDTKVRRHGIRIGVAFSGPMAQYLAHPALARRVIDFCDVDSAKWTQYATGRRPPLSWLYRREGRRLAAFEHAMAATADASVFATEEEAALFTAKAPELTGSVHVVHNGVDAEFFDPALDHADPYPPGGPALVFTGAMDYWPNIDAASWFAREILPEIRRQLPETRFAIVGMNPAPTVQALARLPGVLVTGKVPDVRPWIAHAALSVAPLRIARGVQNKVLEAMAMARPVVASPEAATGLAASCTRVLTIAATAEDWVARTGELLAEPDRGTGSGAAARRIVQERYSWQANLATLDALLEPAAASVPAAISVAPMRAREA